MDTMRNDIIAKVQAGTGASWTDATETADAIMAIYAEDREKLVAALEDIMERCDGPAYKIACAALASVGK